MGEDRKREADRDRQIDIHTHTHTHTHTHGQGNRGKYRGRERRKGGRKRQKDRETEGQGERERTWWKLILFMKSFMENHSVASYSLKSSHYRGEILCDFPYMQNLKKKKETNELIYGIETHRFRERTYDCQWERKGGRDS